MLPTPGPASGYHHLAFYELELFWRLYQGNAGTLTLRDE
jgi:hypothetical protein